MSTRADDDDGRPQVGASTSRARETAASALRARAGRRRRRRAGRADAALLRWMAAFGALSVGASLAVSGAFEAAAAADPAEPSEAASPGRPGAGGGAAPAEDPEPEASACALASGEARLVHARPLCTDCAPDAAVLELTFDRVTDARAVVRGLRVEPEVALDVRSARCARRVLVGGDFAPQREYRVAVSGADGARAFTVATGGGDPTVRVPYPDAVVPPDGRLPIQLEDVRAARLRVLPLRADEIPRAAEVSGLHPADRDPSRLLPEAWRRRVRSRALDPAAGDARGIQRVDPFALAEADGPLLAIVDGPGVAARVTVVQRATHAVVLKVGRAGGLVWVADPRSGRPVRNAAVTLYEGTEVRRRGRTDASGLMRLPAEERLRRDASPGRRHRRRPPLRVVVRAGRTISWASERFDTGIEGWQLGLPRAYHAAAREVRGMVTAERGIYRPGETVHLLGIVRELAADGTLRAPRGRVRLEVADPDGTTVHDATLRLSRFGTLREALALPDGARLGRYQVRLRHGGASLTHRFEVGEYRADTFEVELPPAGPAEREGGAVVVPVRARYLYGAPVSGGQLEWTLSWRPRAIHVPGAERFSFRGEDVSEHLRYVTGDALRLDADGRGRIVVPLEALPHEAGVQAMDLVVEALVRDGADDVVSGRTVQTLAARETWLGVRSDRWVVDTDAGWDLRAVALDPSGRRRAGEAMELRLVRRQWRTHAERGAGGVRYDGGWEDVLVATRAVTSAARPVDVHFDLPGGGRYRVDVVGADGVVVASTRVWAYGRGGRMPVRNHPRMEVIADRSSYAPGERARLFAQVPWARALALVTVEREGVLEARVERLDGTATPIGVDVDGRFAPNAFVGVAAVPVVGDGGALAPASGVPLRVGYRELTVSAEQRRLRVTLEPSAEDVEPGDRASVDVTVRDHRGRPVRAEVTVWAANEGVLQLTGYRTPDPFAPAYARHLHAVSTAASVARWTQPDPYTWADGGGDGGAPGSTGALRSRFLSTAFFARPVVTDRRGRARVRFSLPDDLTRWRVMAAVADRGQRFGHAETAITTSKPLQAMPTLPRFLTEGDLADVGLVVHNHTGRAGTAEVRFEVEGGGAELLGEPVRRVEVADGAQVPVRFQVAARAPGEVSVRARVRLAGAADGFARELPVHPATAWSSEHLGEGTVRGRAQLWMAMPRRLADGGAELYVTLSRSVYASMERGVESLMEYPHGCVEQTTSRLIPMVLLEDLLGDLSRFGGARHRERMNDAIAHVLRHQNDDGGFGLWPSSSSEGFLTAYALWGLLTAREHGYEVSDAALDRAVRYLEAHATEGDDMHGQFSDRETAPFAAYVLAHARREDGGLGARLAAEAQGLSRFSVGLLANALTRRAGEAGPLFSSLDEATRRRRGRALVHDPAGGGSFMRYGADLRATSSAVQALVADGRDAEAADLVAGILAERRADGSWGTTYNNMWALYALTAYAEAEASPAARAPVEVRLDDRVVARVELGASAHVQRVVVPADALPAAGRSARLEVRGPADARIRYAARLRYVVERSAQRPEAHGFEVERALFDARTHARVEHPTVGQLLRVRLRVRTPRAQRQVALVDRLPAGLEAVDTGLATRGGGGTSSALAHGRWDWREIHDERVSFFADRLGRGTHVAEYLARATRSGEYVRPAVRAEAMYDPNVWGRGAIERVLVRRE